MKVQVHYLQQPLQTLQLQGLHLIEASAGTGKTWTLSSLMVRILSEKYMPRQVVATTFTRAAAAELKSRIRKRLVEIYHATLQWQQLQYQQQPIVFTPSDDALLRIIFEKFVETRTGQDVDYLVNRLKLVIDSLDELFVGTIDSFIQKLLREFAFESGEMIARPLAEDEQQYLYQIIHDVLRAWINSQPQKVVDLLLFSQSINSTESYIATVQKTLSFSQAKLQTADLPYIDIAQFEQGLNQFVDYDWAEVEQLKEYIAVDGKYISEWNGTNWRKGVLEKLFMQTLPKLQQDLRLGYLTVLFDQEIKLPLERLGKIFTRYGVKNPDSVQMQAFYQLPVIAMLKQFVLVVEQMQVDLKALDQYLHYYLSIEVKQRLPQVLTHAGETTFNQQTHSLREALLGDKGEYLSQAILQRYPIILVDEFQDTNQEQDDILREVWRNPQRLGQTCFVAVGDPKQAIYGFRGGDILTYINAFNDIASKQGYFYRLVDNFRSTPALVQSVDALFRRQIQFGENIEYYPAQSGRGYDVSLYQKDENAEYPPLRLMQLDAEQSKNEAYWVAQKIRYLLALSQQGELYLDQAQQHLPIKADDIAVLAASHYELDLVERELLQLQIAVNRTARQSVFSSMVAQDIAALLQAIWQPEQQAVLKRALLSSAIGLTLKDFCNFELDAEGWNIHVQNFRDARQTWLQKGFLIAWEGLVERYKIWQNLAQNTAQYAERTIVNAKHLIEVLSQHSWQYAGLQQLIQWYQLQLGSPAQREWELERKLSSESGVQLMTIHKSKGLEFKIVFLLHANKEIKVEQQGLAFYQQQNHPNQTPTRVIAISTDMIRDHATALQAHQEKIMAENHRLWYVALTRASYRAYAVLHHQKTPPKVSGGLGFWLDAQTNNFIGRAASNESVHSPELVYTQQRQTQIQLYAVPYPNKRFYPSSRTSFSTLAAHLRTQHSIDTVAEVSLLEQAAQDESEQQLELQNTVDDTANTILDWIRCYFPKGKHAGNCLHAILEDLDFQDMQIWEDVFISHLKRSQLWSSLIAVCLDTQPELQEQEDAARRFIVTHLSHWFKQIVASPLQHAGQLCLADIPRSHRLPEFPFFLALSEQYFDTQKLHQLFLAQGLNMPEFEKAHTASFLKGAIDLVYFDGQRYHIADYKSNALGDCLQDYSVDRIEDNMSTSSYWLQAGIYLVALHRYLQQHLKEYDPFKHLGGASYLYLRGMTEHADYGVKFWQPTIDFILALDQFFGQASGAIVDKAVDNFV